MNENESIISEKVKKGIEQNQEIPTLNKNEEKELLFELVSNAMLFRQEMANKMLDPRRDIDIECGYPKTLTPLEYRLIYDREGIGTRVVSIYPEESWALDPLIYETEDSNETEFEKEWNELQTKMNLFHYLQRIDELSGIGRYGIILLGIDDGNELNIPIEGINEYGQKEGNSQYKLLYVRVFDESVVEIVSREMNIQSPRYNLPVMYSVKFEDGSGEVGEISTKNVHWTRVIHIADNRKMSEIYGVPRMQTVFNRLLDIRKVLSGSGEMFWKGAFPGYSFEVNPEVAGAELNTASLKTQFDNYMNGLQRYLATKGVTVKSLSPQVADPKSHIDVELKVISIILGIPARIFFGSEEAKLASSQDIRTWNKRLARRQNKYLSPMLIRPFIDRLISFGILPEPKEYIIDWPDLNTVTDEEKAEVALKRTEALTKYVQGGVNQLVPPREYFIQILELSSDITDAIMLAAEDYAEETEEEKEMEGV